MERREVGQLSSGSALNASQSVYFLGGRDLEMVEIARVLAEQSIPYFDGALDWSDATFSAYAEDIRSIISQGRRPVLVEVRDIPSEVRPMVDVIDHHGPESGHLPTCLEAVLARIGIPQLTREQQLIAANDRGYIEGMAAIGATTEEIQRIRALDRKAQGITHEQELAGEEAIKNLDNTSEGLAVAHLPHGRTATVTDRLSMRIGGHGYSNLLVVSPDELSFFGGGRTVLDLVRGFGGYCGGQLPSSGYWGLRTSDESMRSSIRNLIVASIAHHARTKSGT
jgi:hypothetical protein